MVKYLISLRSADLMRVDPPSIPVSTLNFDVAFVFCVVTVTIVTSRPGEASFDFLQFHAGRRTLVCCTVGVNAH